MTVDAETLPIFDFDNHMYESPDALLRYLPERYKGKLRFVDVEGRTLVAVQNRIVDFIPNPTFSVVAGPGTFIPFYSANNPEGLSLREMAGELIRPPAAYRDDPAARLALMDEHRVDQTIVYPSLANLVEQNVRADPGLTHAIIHALNRWMLETWSFDYQGRIFATPVITLGLVDEAIRELDWLLENDARVLVMRPAPPEGHKGHRSFALPEFDPFWSWVQDAGIPICIHVAQSIIESYVELWEPRDSSAFTTVSAFSRLASGHRDIEDAVTSLICHGALTRFPALRFATVENGTEWLPGLMERLERAYRQTPKLFPEEPISVLTRNFWFHPFWEDHLPQLIDHIGSDRIVFGSDYPHPEGLVAPRDYFEHLTGVSDDDVRRIMRDNALEFVGSTVAGPAASGAEPGRSVP